MPTTALNKLSSLVSNRQDFFISQLGLFYWEEKTVLYQNSLETVQKLSLLCLKFFKCEHEFFLPIRFKHTEPHLKLTAREQECLFNEFTRSLVNNVYRSRETSEELWIVNLPDCIVPVFLHKPKVVITRQCNCLDFSTLDFDDFKIVCKLERFKIFSLPQKGSEHIFLTVGLNEELGFELMGQGKESVLPAFCDLAIFALDQKIVSQEAFLDSKFTAGDFVFLKVDKYQKLKVSKKLVQAAVLSSSTTELKQVLSILPQRCRKPFLESCGRWGRLN